MTRELENSRTKEVSFSRPRVLASSYHRSLINSRMRVGLLGGSFNPAHEGHLHISLLAMKYFRLHQVWWLVSPQNPLKKADELADYKTRFSKALSVAAHPHIIVTEFEKDHNLKYSYQTVARLKRQFSRVEFIWVMGGDNLATLHKWKKWKKLTSQIPMAIFDREEFGKRAHKYPASRMLKSFSQPGGKARLMAGKRPPRVTYIRMRKNPLSATALRKLLGKKAFLR